MNYQTAEGRYRPTIGITIGDVNGIGPEVIIKTVSEQKLYEYATIVLYGHGKTFSHYKKMLEATSFTFYQFNKGDHFNERKANVVNCWEEDIEVKPGEENEVGGQCALAALQYAVEDLRNGVIDAVVTAPISKHNIQSDQFKFPGHTEFFTETFGAKDSLMFLCNENLRVGVATGHIPLMKIKEALTPEKLTSKINLMLQSIKNDFGINKPRLAVLGLNPHAGEGGLLGSEEQELISPIIKEFREKGNLVFGPFPADGFFGNSSYRQYDGVLAMYHDQGLIPFKTIAFEDGVNFTAGLSIVRTSPDHGTAFGIAGKNEASPSSMRAALYMAIDIVRTRKG